MKALQTGDFCQYGDSGCTREIRSADDSLCVFHAPSNKKLILPSQFNRLIVEQIRKKDYDFEGYIFPAGIAFSGLTFDSHTSFKNAIFEGNVIDYENFSKAGECANFEDCEFKDDAIFEGVQFKGGSVNFENSIFHKNVSFNDSKFPKGFTNFYNIQIHGKRADFSSTEFLGEFVSFSKAQFLCDESVFWGSIFSGGDIYFSQSEFKGDVDFKEVKFTGGHTNFEEAKFLRKVQFLSNEFSGDIRFRNNKICRGITFDGILFSHNSSFYFQNPDLSCYEEKIKNQQDIAPIKFLHIRFNPFSSFFQDIKIKKSDEFAKSGNPLILFRYCQLKDVYFNNSDLSVISFYKSSFDNARFISCSWCKKRERWYLFKYTRNNILLEEQAYEYVMHDPASQNTYDQTYELRDLNYQEIASLYRQMKFALDRSKDYQNAGCFYYNEYEIKRKALISSVHPKIKRIFKGRYLLYCMFRKLAGYGERPLWSFLWLIGFAWLFAFLHLFLGTIKYKDQIINYDWALPKYWIQTACSSEFRSDLVIVFVYSLTRIIPLNYFPNNQSLPFPEGVFGLLLSVLNSIFLLIMVTFTGVGLKRHFRRF
jgi:uncharacterized protein YjbI with pentapeptide repeats